MFTVSNRPQMERNEGQTHLWLKVGIPFLALVLMFRHTTVKLRYLEQDGTV